MNPWGTNTHKTIENLTSALSTETAKSIIGQIERWVAENSTGRVVCENWYVGITNYPYARASAHQLADGQLKFWKVYDAKSRRIAEAIETFFHDKKMQGKDVKGGAKDDSRYIYVYLKY